MRGSGRMSLVAVRRGHRSRRRVRATATAQDRSPEPVDAVAGRGHERRAKRRRIEPCRKRGGAGDVCRGTDADAAEPRAAVGAAAAALDLQGGEERGGLWEVLVAGTVAVGVEELDESGLVLFADAFELEDLAEIRVGFVADVDEVGLHEGFGRRGPDLERFEERVDLGHALGHALDVPGWCGRAGMVDVEELFEPFLQDVRVEEHLF